MTSLKRKQLTLFIKQKESLQIEKIRKAFNPIQYELIKSHVTLCREDELNQIEKIRLNLKALNLQSITLNLGQVERFSNGKGVFLPAVGNNESFHHLRKLVLQGIIADPQQPTAHCTLMHPGNSSCTDEIFDQIIKCSFPERITFDTISLIEQEAGKKWKLIEEFKLKKY